MSTKPKTPRLGAEPKKRTRTYEAKAIESGASQSQDFLRRHGEGVAQRPPPINLVKVNAWLRRKRSGKYMTYRGVKRRCTLELTLGKGAGQKCLMTCASCAATTYVLCARTAAATAMDDYNATLFKQFLRR